ncbi:MAG: cytochrome c oxidase assembly protein [Vicinamibacterales bacterium]
MTAPLFLGAGLLVLALAWLGPLPLLAARFFTAHMTVHMAVVAIAAPLLAIGCAVGRFDMTRYFPSVFSPVPASAVELIVVWAWHAPALHQLARASATGFACEQLLFLLAGYLVWMSSLGGDARHGGGRAGAGVVALLLTSMHMTLLGALLALSPRPLYVHANLAGLPPLDPLVDQHIGGVMMLLVGGFSYLAGGLWLSSALLRTGRTAPVEHR